MRASTTTRLRRATGARPTRTKRRRADPGPRGASRPGRASPCSSQRSPPWPSHATAAERPRHTCAWHKCGARPCGKVRRARASPSTTSSVQTRARHLVRHSHRPTSSHPRRATTSSHASPRAATSTSTLTRSSLQSTPLSATPAPGGAKPPSYFTTAGTIPVVRTRMTSSSGSWMRTGALAPTGPEARLVVNTSMGRLRRLRVARNSPIT